MMDFQKKDDNQKVKPSHQRNPKKIMEKVFKKIKKQKQK